jgi:hypothetical protein
MSKEGILWTAIIGFVVIYIAQVTWSLKIYMQLRRMNGRYTEYDSKGIAKDDSKLYVKFGLRNLIWFGNVLIIRQECIIRGDWVSKIPISLYSPLKGTGTYKYLTGPVNTWGTHHITINPDSKIIFIEAIPNNPSGQRIYKYWIQKDT